MEVVGDRITLRYPVPDDAGALLTLGADDDVTRFFSWGPYRQLGEPLAYIDSLAAERDHGRQLDFVVVDRTAGPIGIIGLSELAPRDRRAVVGTWLGRPHWGTGANRAAKALIAHLAFGVLGLERLGAYADLENARSQAALAAIGFQQEGRLRRWHRHGEHTHDVLIYSWLREEWERSPLAAAPARVLGEPPAAFRVVAGDPVPTA